MKLSKSYWIRSGFLTLMERFSVLLFGFGSVAILFRVLPKEVMAVWVIFLTVTGIIEVSRSGLLQNALVKFLTTSEGKEYALINTASLCLNLIVTAFIASSLLLFSEPLSVFFKMEMLHQLFLIYCLTNICLLPFFQFNFVQQANLEFRGVFWSNFTRQGLTFLYILGLWLTESPIGLIDLAIIRTVAAAIAGGVSWYFARPFLQFDWNVSWEWIGKLFHYGKYIFGTNLSTMLYRGIDKMMLGVLLSGTGAAAVYEAAIKITNYTDVPTQSVASILFPQSARRMKEGKGTLKILYEKAVGAILAFIIPAIIMVMLFADILVLIVGGEKYTDAADLLRLTILYGLFIPFAVQFGTVLDSTGRPKINFCFTLVSAVLNIGFNYLFITRFGVVGAAYGTLTTYVIVFIFMQLYLNRIYGIVPFRAFKYMFDFYKIVLRFGQQWLRQRLFKTNKSLDKQIKEESVPAAPTDK